MALWSFLVCSLLLPHVNNEMKAALGRQTADCTGSVLFQMFPLYQKLMWVYTEQQSCYLEEDY